MSSAGTTEDLFSMRFNAIRTLHIKGEVWGKESLKMYVDVWEDKNYYKIKPIKNNQKGHSYLSRTQPWV